MTGETMATSISSLSDWFGLFVVALAVLAAIASGAAYFRVNYMKATIKTQKDMIDAQASRLTEYDEAMQDRDEKIERLTTELDRVSHENAMLRGVVTGRAAIQELTELLKVHHQKVEDELTTMRKNQKNMLELLGTHRAVDLENGEATG